jgi:hypothetical protein
MSDARTGVNPEVIDYPFLQSVYEDEGINLKREELALDREYMELSEKVATDLVELLRAEPTRVFPKEEIPDPTGQVSIPFQLVTSRFELVERTDLRISSDRPGPDPRYEGRVLAQSPYRDLLESYRSLGSLSFRSGAQVPYIDSLSLSRSRGVDENFDTAYGLKFTVEAVGLLGMVSSYLDAVK